MIRHRKWDIVNSMMANLSHEDMGRTDADLEAEADRKLAKRLSGARLHLIGQTVINFFEHTTDDCPVCDRGQKQAAYDTAREHAVCLSCGKCTKYLQRSITAVLRTLDEQKRFWKNFRRAKNKFKPKGKGRGNHGADPGRGARQAAEAMARRYT